MNDITAKKTSGGRKDNGDGSIYQVSPTKWVAKIYLGKKPNGKADYKSFSGKTEAIAKRKLKEFKKERGLFANVKESGITLKDYITKWMQAYRKLELKPTSYDRLESTINQHVIPNLGCLQFVSVTHDNVQHLIKKLLNDKKSYSSIKKVYNALNACYNHAMMLGDIDKNPCFGVTLPSELSFEKKDIIFFNEVVIIVSEQEKMSTNHRRNKSQTSGFLTNRLVKFRAGILFPARVYIGYRGRNPCVSRSPNGDNGEHVQLT